MIFKNNKVSILFCFSFCFSFLQAEYFIFNTIDGQGTAINNFNTNYRNAIEIRLKYQFPISSSPLSNVTLEEKRELYSNNPAAEENFLRRKIQTQCPNLNIAFIPSVLFELFLLNLIYFDYDSQNGQFIVPAPIDRKIRYSEEITRFRTPSMFIKYVYGVNKDKDNDFLDQSGFRNYVSSMSSRIETEIANGNAYRIWNIYNQANQFEQVKKANFFIEKIIIQYLLKKGINLNQLIENADEFIETFKNILDELIRSIIRIKHENYLSEFESFLSSSPGSAPSFLNTNLIGDTSIGDTSSRSFISTLEDPQNINLLKTILETEFRVRHTNEYLIYKGSNSSEIIYQNIDEHIKKEINETEEDGQAETRKIEEARWRSFREANLKRPRSISFGSSLFSGIVYDQSNIHGAVAFYFMANLKIAYALKINKNNFQNLFFIPPTDRIISFHGGGEWFHPRSKIAIPYDIARNLDLYLFSIGGLSFDSASHGEPPLYIFGKYSLLENVLLINKPENQFEREILDYIRINSIYFKPVRLTFFDKVKSMWSKIKTAFIDA